MTPNSVYKPAPASEPVWDIDQIGDVFAVATIFAMILLVGLASCWECFA